MGRRADIGQERQLDILLTTHHGLSVVRDIQLRVFVSHDINTTRADQRLQVSVDHFTR